MPTVLRPARPNDFNFCAHLYFSGMAETIRLLKLDMAAQTANLRERWDVTEVEIIKAELEEKQFKVKLTVIDTPGFGDYVNNRDSWSPIVEFIDDQHEAYMRQEQQPQRQEKTDLRVHACLYFIRPTGHT